MWDERDAKKIRNLGIDYKKIKIIPKPLTLFGTKKAKVKWATRSVTRQKSNGKIF
jgi:hypothetical protein